MDCIKEIVSKTFIDIFFISSQINTIPGLLIFRFQAPLCFLSSYVFRRRLEQAAQMDLREWGKKNDGILKKLVTKVICVLDSCLQ